MTASHLSNRPEVPDDLREALDQEAPNDPRSLAAVWRLMGDTDPEAQPNTAITAAAWERLEHHLDAEAPDAEAPDAAASASAQAPDRAPRRAPRAAWLRRRVWGAVAALLAGVVVLWGLQRPVHVVAPLAQQQVYTLPDGSVVTLNSGSWLQHPSALGRWLTPAQSRHVTLQGEAFFEVETAETPFVVETDQARVQVLGTQFNVRTWEGRTTVALTEGRVRLAARALAEGAVILAPGETATVTQADVAPAPPQAVGLDRALAWRSGGFAVTRTSLRAVFAELERRYDVPITVQPELDSPRAQSLEAPLTLFYPQPTPLETLLDDLCTEAGLNYRPSSRGYEIY
ncbi:MAG: FecR domain-containing protein [Bacteroidota bacterium]